MKQAFRLFTFTALALSLVLMADFGSVSNAQNPCKGEIERLCGDVTPGGGRILHCLKAYEDKISPECKNQIEKTKKDMAKSFQTWQQACERDAKRLCPNVPAGQGRILKCLQAHKNQMSPECRGKLGK